jgi:hypothetical protein
MDSIVSSAKGVFSKKDDKKKDKKDKKNHKKSDSKKDSKGKKEHNKNKKDAKPAVPAAADKNVTAVEVLAQNTTVAAVPEPVEEVSTSIIPSLSSFFSNWSKPGPHPAYVSTVELGTKKSEEAKKPEEEMKAESKK